MAVNAGGGFLEPTIANDEISIIAQSVTFAPASTLSATIPQVAGAHLVGIQIPSGWVTAAISFLAGADGVTYQSVYDITGTEVILGPSLAASTYIVVPPILLPRVQNLQLRSGSVTNGTTSQTSGCTLTLLFSRYM